MTKYTDIGVEKHGHVGLIEIRKPPLNFFDIALINQIADALEEFDKDIEIRASVLAAQGKAFCAGANFSDPKRQEQEAERRKRIRPPTCRSTISIVQAVRIFRNKKPIVAAVHGAAIGGGLGLAVSADFRVTCPEARFAANFTKLGFHPGFGLTATLPELVGKNNAELIFYTSRRVTGEEATRMGLANLCVPQDQVRAEAMKLAAEIAECSPLGLISTRATMRAGLADRVLAATNHELAEQNGCAPPKISRKASRRRPNAAWRISRGGETAPPLITVVPCGSKVTHTPRRARQKDMRGRHLAVSTLR